MKNILLIIKWLLCFNSFSQTKDTTSRTLNRFSNPDLELTSTYSINQTTKNSFKPEIFTSGFIDIVNSGQVNASARFIRLYVGEPGKFAIPLSLYSGVSSNSFQNPTIIQRSNDVLVTN